MISATVKSAADASSYDISFTANVNNYVQVFRSAQNVKDLNEALRRSCSVSIGEPPADLLLGESPTSADLERFLNYWLGFFSDNVTVSELLVNFMEDVPGQQDVAQLQFSYFREKIFQLTTLTRRYETELEDMQAKSSELTEMVAHLQQKVRSLSTSSDDAFAVPHGMSTTENSPLALGLSLQSRLSVRDSPASSLAVDIPLRRPTPDAPLAAEAESPRHGGAHTPSTGNQGPSAADALQNAEALRELYPSHGQARFFDEGVRDVLGWIAPDPSQISFRASVMALIKRQVRFTLRVNAFECGLHELRCFLPDDVTKLSVVMGKLRASQWHKTVSDRLTLLAGQPELSRVAVVVAMDEEYAADQDDEYPVYDHVVSKVLVSSEEATFKVECAVDGTDVAVYCNRRGDVCILAFLEEVSALVGQDDLFKRSLLFIRAWWVYETNAYVTSPVRHSLGDFCMCIMVCAVFNQYHARISSPLQALCLFLAEYSAYDGTKQVITLQGVVPFLYGDSNAIHLPDIQEHHLLSTVILEKYWALFNIAEVSAMPTHYGQVQLVDEINEDLTRGSFLSRGHMVHGSPYFANYAAGAVHNSAQRAYSQPTTRLDRLCFNVAHPFMSANMMERLSARRIQRVQKVFAIGAEKLLSILRKAPEDSPAGITQAVRAFFPVINARFGQGFVRPDRISQRSPQFRNSTQYADSKLMQVHPERLMQHILYCNFVLESVLSDAALLMLCTEILKEKKIQPVGEVGKMLAEITSTPNMSQGLKEKFGGLKKFLEHYTGIFIFSADHPFNPCVTLRSILESMRLEVSDAGVQALTAYYKARKNGAKRSPQHQFPSPDMNSVSQLSRDSASFTPSSAGSSSLRSSIGGYSIASPPASALSLPTSGVRESYTYGGGGGIGGGGVPPADNRRKIAAYGASTMHTEVPSPWRQQDVEPGRQMGVQQVPSVPLYSPRLTMQRAMQTRTYPPPQQQQQQQQQQQVHHQQQPPPAPADPRGASRQQYAPMPQPGYANNAYPRHFNRGYQGQPPPSGLSPPSSSLLGTDPRASYGGVSVRPPSSLPLYARAGAPVPSPQQQQRELEAARYSSTTTPGLNLSITGSPRSGPIGPPAGAARHPNSGEFGMSLAGGSLGHTEPRRDLVGLELSGYGLQAPAHVLGAPPGMGLGLGQGNGAGPGTSPRSSLLHSALDPADRFDPPGRDNANDQHWF